MRNKRRINNADEGLEARNVPMRLIDKATPWATRHICIEGLIGEERAGGGERGSAKASAQLATSSLMKAVAAIQ